ncbi:MAG: hypothetical protein DI603_09630 [Roseateles depolymerans]|uniref:Histidine kinase/HSP90-like ATPase domain-containing protein n=1 Tax=Roseateles depolymerans TaxID=76731 RepID=A0A2W5DM22_9BURK|nr:MAG: hypothetical protein DI603_09630 [Roseateles depolymerans]
MRILSFICAVVVVLGLLPSPARAAPALQPLTHLHHTAWTAQDGVPGQVVALAQTPDGYLWLGTPNGLFRFDGVRFERFDAIAGESLPAKSVLTLMATPDGGLWVGFMTGGTAFVRDGRVLRTDAAQGLFDMSTRRFARQRDGTLWVVTGRALLKLVDERWVPVSTESGYVATGRVGSMDLVVDPADNLWVASTQGVYVQAAGQARFQPVAVRDLNFSALAVDPQGRVWASDTDHGRGIVRLPRPGVAGDRADDWHAAPNSLFAPAFDAQGRLWYGDSEGLVRAPVPGEAGAPERLTPDQRLSGDFVMNLLHDRDGSVWVGTNGGLDRLRPARVARVDFPRKASQVVMLGGRDGTVWLAARQQGLLRGAERAQPVATGLHESVTAMMEGADGQLWLGTSDGVWRGRPGGRFEHLLPPAERGPWRGEVRAMVQQRSGAVWIASNNFSLFRVDAGRWTYLASRNGYPPGPPSCLAVDGRDRVWLGYSDGVLLRVDENGQLTRWTAAQGQTVGGVKALRVVGDHVWVGGENGLLRVDEQGLRVIRARAPGRLEGLSGVVETADGDVWVNGAAGIAHVPAAELRRALAGADPRVEAELFDTLDGLPGRAEQMDTSATALQGPDGRLWFSLTNGVVTVDPARLTRNTRPPWTAVQRLSAGGRDYPGQAALQLPAGTRDLQLDYTATALAMPERVEFRYRLVGLDADWQAAGTRRRAYYTNLAPGRYEFQVLASNEDGVWATVPGTRAFEILPTPTQTVWFRALCVLAVLAALWGAYALRARHVRGRFRDRLQVRMRERERIARDLHDTLLQGFYGLMLRFQAVAAGMPAASASRAELEAVLTHADEILLESRDRVTGLRELPRPESLVQTLLSFGQGLAQGQATEFLLSEQGAPRLLQPWLHEEVCFIAREALCNAFRHARATRVGLCLQYGDEAFRLSVWDDGQGLPKQVLAEGARPGHWGLAGMRERAERIDARLLIERREGGGTQVLLEIAARRAYAPAA